MSYLFFADSNLKNIDLSSFDVSEVTDMSYMFYATSLESINLSGWNASKCTNMKGMFLNCSELKNADLSKELEIKQAPTLVVIENGRVTKYTNVSNIKKYLGK